MSTVSLPCAKCGADVPEGSRSCPECGAGLASVVLSKYRLRLSRTLIGKAVELRNSIPWATPSAVVLVDDANRPGKKKLRTAARNVLLLILAAAGLYAWRYVGQKPVVVFEVASTPPQIKPVDSRQEAPSSPPEAQASARAAASEKPPPVAEAPSAPIAIPSADAAPAISPLAKKGTGTLVVMTRHKGKAVKDADVTINGLNLGSTPVKAQVAPGRYTVKISKRGFKSEKRASVDVRRAKKQTLIVELRR